MIRSLIAAAALLAAGCNKGDIEVRSEDPDRPADYGLGAVLAAVQDMAGERTSPAAYRRFYDKVEAQRPGFSESVAEIAELHEVFLAVGPLDAAFDLPPDQQLERLAATVWPVVFKVQPRPEEQPRAYIERICGAEMQLDCKYVVPEHWPLILGKLVWKDLDERARDAYRGCATCKADPEYATALKTLLDRSLQVFDKVAMMQEDVHPKSWPAAEDHARPWTNPLLLARARGGALRLDGTPVSAGKLKQVLAARRGTGTLLGVYLRPDAEVGPLKAIAADAAAAGYQELALLARQPAYPWPEREYRIAIGKAARRRKLLVVRDVDTIQMLVQALDVELATSPEAPALNARAAGLRH